MNDFLLSKTIIRLTELKLYLFSWSFKYNNTLKMFFWRAETNCTCQPTPRNFTKGYHSVVTHVLYHFCDMSLITAIFCSLKFDVLCTCTFFRDYMQLPSWQIGKWSWKWLWMIYMILCLTYMHAWLLTLLFQSSIFERVMVWKWQ